MQCPVDTAFFCDLRDKITFLLKHVSHFIGNNPDGCLLSIATARQ
jgi:hypothetical protein